jgi:hypothetical protein
MQEIPAPYVKRRITPWHTFADGTWREAVRGPESRGGDFDSHPSTFARACRAWGKRHQCTATAIVKGNRVRFQLVPDRLYTIPEAGAPAADHPADTVAPAGAAHRVDPVSAAADRQRAARKAWDQATLKFLGPVVAEEAPAPVD